MSNTEDRRPVRYFRSKDSRLKKRDELWVVEMLFDSMKRLGEGIYHSPCEAPSEPPDCIAFEISSGHCVGFEVTELVDQHSAALAAKGTREFKLWSLEGLTKKLQDILSDKDGIQYGTSPCSRTVLIIATDEVSLRYQDVVADLEKHWFAALQNLSEAYLLFSFDPYEETSPYIRLRFADQ